jgi:hypothetical protein
VLRLQSTYYYYVLHPLLLLVHWLEPERREGGLYLLATRESALYIVQYGGRIHHLGYHTYYTSTGFLHFITLGCLYTCNCAPHTITAISAISARPIYIAYTLRVGCPLSPRRPSNIQPTQHKVGYSKPTAYLGSPELLTWNQTGESVPIKRTFAYLFFFRRRRDAHRIFPHH